MLHFETVFDEPPTPAVVPFKINNGAHPAVRVTDNMVRLGTSVARCDGSPALIGLKIAKPDRRVRVTVRLRISKTTAEWWQRVMPSDVTSRDAYQPRVLIVRSQGATRATIVVARKPGAFFYDSRPVVCFDLEPDELSDDGLLVIELAEPRGLPEWAMSWLAAGPAIGVAIASVAVSEANSEPISPGREHSEDGIVSVGPATFAGPGPWMLRADPRRQASADPAPVTPGVPWGPRPPSAPKPRMREKAIAIARQRLSGGFLTLRLASSHAVSRCGRALATPFARVRAPIRLGAALRPGTLPNDALPRAILRAELVTFDGTPPIMVTVRRRSASSVEVQPAQPLTGPALLCVHAGRKRLRWRLQNVAR